MTTPLGSLYKTISDENIALFKPVIKAKEAERFKTIDLNEETNMVEER